MNQEDHARPDPDADRPTAAHRTELSGSTGAARYQPRLHVVLYEPEIPPNAGAVARTCVATAAKLWFVRPLGFQLDDYHLRRAGLDYWPHLEWQAVDDWSALVEALGRPDSDYYYVTTRGALRYDAVRYAPADVLVFGRESSGLPAELLARHAARTIRIPQRPFVRSLNVSNAAALVLYEAWRQSDWDSR